MGVLKNYYLKNKIVCGCDEVGRGCVAGDLYAAAVVLPKSFKDTKIKDSKKLTPQSRKKLERIIKEKAIDFCIAKVSIDEINGIDNIQNSCYLALHRAISGLKTQPDFILVDGNVFDPYNKVPHKCVIGGDNIYYSIAAASILAKVCRDEAMVELHKEYPEYNWEENKGYLTEGHLNAIRTHGVTKYHRIHFTPVKDYISTGKVRETYALPG